jgi:hypothetical protein
MEYREIKDLLADIAKRQAEADKRQAEADKRWEERMAKLDKKHEEAIARGEKLDARIKAIGDHVNGISKSNGLIADNYFYESIYETKKFGGIQYDEIKPKMHSIKKMPDKTRLEGEYDLVLLNDVSVCLIETKYRVRLDDIANLVNKQVVNFKILFPDFADYNYYLGIGGWYFDEKSDEEAKRLGIGILKLCGDAVVIDDSELKVY